MKDELERLLQVEEEEQEQVADELNLRAAGYAGAWESGVLPEEVQEEKAVRFSGEGGEFSRFDRRSGEEVETETRGEENARSFYQLLTRTRRMARTAVRSGEKARTPMVRQERAETRPGQDARWLDRIFQRDARRYDGGFTWQ